MDAIAPKQRINALFGKYKYPILVILVGLGLVLLPGKAETAPVQTAAQTAPDPGLEERLEQILSGIAGAGQVRVLLTEETGRSTIYLSIFSSIYTSLTISRALTISSGLRTG